ncbi:MAG TPA: polymorphic toxin-type HINT domain-containing protein, partial [Acidimicrobiales bacterium]|nr:polymorphic toxin-type HINT domain-containing protein [Acidimicrobiales bacterium]
EHPPQYTPAQIAALDKQENEQLAEGKLVQLLASTKSEALDQIKVLSAEFSQEDNAAQQAQAQSGWRGLIADASAGIGDVLTFGAGGYLRNALISGLGQLNPVNEHSGVYQIASDVAMVATIWDPIGDAADAAAAAQKAEDAAKTALSLGEAAKAASELAQASTDTIAAIDHLGNVEKSIEEDLGKVENELSCGGQSFSASTLVVLANGQAVPISSMKPGEKVLATDPKTGKTTAETVEAVWVHQDTDLLDVEVDTPGGKQTISSTVHHLFYDLTTHRWTEAHALRAGDRLYTANGTIATVAKTFGTTGAAVMWDLTVQSDHDFYVQLVTSSVLVHNCDGTGVVQEYDTVPYRPSNSPLENHHGVLDVWAKNNIPGYVSRAAGSPTMALSAANHAATNTVYRAWMLERTGRAVGGTIDWASVGPRDIQALANSMFEAAGAPQDAIDAYYRAFNRYVYGLR